MKNFFSINNKKGKVPNDTIAIVRHDKDITKNQINLILEPLKKHQTRNWMPKDANKCLPLVMGNQQGFIIKSEFDIFVEWDGSDSKDCIKIFHKEEDDLSKTITRVESHFGFGILTFAVPFTLRTPKGINLLVMPPSNYVTEFFTPLTGFVEADNLSTPFTINLRAHIPNIRLHIPKGTPLVTVLPIARYSPEGFELKYEEDVFSKEVVEFERQIIKDELSVRFNLKHLSKIKNDHTLAWDRTYFSGTDIYGNPYEDHQTSLIKKPLKDPSDPTQK